MKTPGERFDAKVDKSGPGGCWVWTGKRSREGYGRFSLDGRLVNAHRWSWERAVGPIPNGLLVCHHCDNPPCVNPEHLFVGTIQDNTRDMLAKGRGNTRGLARGPIHRNTPGFVDSRIKTHCKRGHELAVTAVRTKWNNARVCTECVRVRRRRKTEISA